VGGGLTGLIAAYSTAWLGWRNAFFVPGILAVMCAVYLLIRLRDTPQSVGLPPIEEYKNDYPAHATLDHEQELATHDLLVNYILRQVSMAVRLGNFLRLLRTLQHADGGPPI
jgi:OPA family glycerol-3-phosphate transporter-like MFS transporter